MTTKIPLTKGYEATVDDIDADLLNIKWHAQVDKGKNVYAMQNYRLPDNKPTKRAMSRIVLSRMLGRELETYEFADHIDRDTLNNRRGNLRLTSNGQNRMNAPKQRNNKTGYKGVMWLKRYKCYIAVCTADGKVYRKQGFKTAIEAAKAYDEMALQFHKEYAVLNFPDLTA